MLERRIWLSIAGLFTLLAVSTSHATSLLYASFSDAEGTTPPSGWTNHDLPSDDGVTNGSLSVAGLQPSTGNRFRLDNSGSLYTSPTWTPILANSGESIFYSFLLRVDDLGTMTTGNNFNATIMIGDESDTNSIGGSAQAGVGLKLDDDNPNAYNLVFSSEHRGVSNANSVKDTNEFTVGETVFVVAAFDIAMSGNDGTGRFWINPSSGDFGATNPPTENHSQTDLNTGDEFDCIVVFEGTSSLGIPAEWTIDEIRVGTNWAEVTPADACVNPDLLNMSGTGTFCSVDGAQTFGVTGATEADVLYELRLNGSAVEGVSGTGASFTFTAVTNAGAYTVVGVRGSCETEMTGSASIADKATVDAGPDQTVGRGETVQLAGAFGGGASGAHWSGGEGTFSPDTNSVTATYTPSLTEKTNGTVTLTLTAAGDFAPCSPTNDTVTITLTNNLPVADGQSVSTLTNTAKAITLTASDADDDTLSFSIVDNPTNGSLSGSAPSITYDPDPGFIGTDSFTFKVNDGTDDSPAATVTITVAATPVNNPPVAVDDTASVGEGSTISIDVLANDTDDDLDPLSIDSVETPAQGSVSIVGDTLSYTAPSAFTGLVSFTYVVTDGTDSDTGTVSVTVIDQPASAALNGRDYRIYFMGNSLTRGLSSASGQDRARLESLFRFRGSRMIFGTQVEAGVNLDEHVVKQRLTVTTPVALSLTYMDDWGESNTSTNDYGYSYYRDYFFALQGHVRDITGATNTGNVFDALVLQPYQSLLEHSQYDAADQAKADRGDRSAISNLISYAYGNNPSNHRAVKQVFIYSAWPRLEGMESRAVDSDTNGVYTFSEFYAAPFSAADNPANTPDAGELVPSRDYVDQLWAALQADHAGLDKPIRLIPVGEVMVALDGLIISNQLPGVSNYFARNAAYYLNARLDGNPDLVSAGFTFLYPPGDPSSISNAFVREQGFKNFYADKVHMNNQTHNDEDSGTIGAFAAAATVYAVISGEHPRGIPVEDVVSAYEKFDAVEDAALIRAIQDAVWDVITSTNLHGIDYAERTGVVDVPARAVSYEGFASYHFSPAQLADPLVSGPSADADGDGSLNLEEFYRQTAPTNPASLDALEIFDDGEVPRVTLSGLRHTPGLIPRFEISTNLQVWSAIPIDSLAASDGSGGLSAYAYDVGSGENKGYYRNAWLYIPDADTLPMVQWGPGTNILNGNQNFVNGLDTLSIDTNTPSTPAVGASYYPDNADATPIFYAAASALTTNSVNTYRLNEADPDNDVMIISFAKDDAEVNAGAFAAVWMRDGDGSSFGFLNGANTNDVTLAHIGLAASVNSSATGPNELRFIIQQGDDWYISDVRGTITAGTFAEVKEIANPYAVQWYAFDPSDISAIGSPVDLLMFNDINAVGFQWVCYVDGGFQNLQVESFSASFFDQ